jgi:SAM-dependent methyltransferase
MFQARIPGPAMRAPTTSGVATTTVDMRPETIIRENLVSYVCPSCHKPLDKPHCGAPYAVENGIADFSGGAYYDTFNSEDELTAEHKIGLAAEIAGSRWRIERFYMPMIEGGAKVLDCGCGNGVSVDVLHEHGYNAWGVDLSALRKWQWRERTQRDRLAVANALRLPFEDGAFDVVISSGVIEHIGVEETGGASYHVKPMPNRDAMRQDFIDELLRVTKPGGRVFVDCPNGAFPIDFWHGGAGGRARWHSRREGFLPAFDDIRTLARDNDVRAISPHRRFAFRQVGRHWYGRVFSAPVSMLFALMKALPYLARTALNPYLVVEIRKSARRDSPTR